MWDAACCSVNHHHMDQNGSALLLASVHLSVCPIDRQQRQWLAGLLLNAGVCSRYGSTAVGP